MVAGATVPSCILRRASNSDRCRRLSSTIDVLTRNSQQIGTRWHPSSASLHYLSRCYLPVEQLSNFQRRYAEGIVCEWPRTVSSFLTSALNSSQSGTSGSIPISVVVGVRQAWSLCWPSNTRRVLRIAALDGAGEWNGNKIVKSIHTLASNVEFLGITEGSELVSERNSISFIRRDLLVHSRVRLGNLLVHPGERVRRLHTDNEVKRVEENLKEFTSISCVDPSIEDVRVELESDFNEEDRGESRHQQKLVEASYVPHNLSSADEEEADRRAKAQAIALLQAALDEADEENEAVIRAEDQRSLRVGIVGAPNAGKSLLTNKLVGSRVSAVSHKTNTTHREHLGVCTKGDTQLCFYDTPGLHLDIEGHPLRVEAQHRVKSAWEIVSACEAVVVLVDAERQIRRPDRRVKRLVEKLGTEEIVSQKKILVLNKVDLIEQKKQLLPLAKEFESLPAYDRIFMISASTGSGVKDVKDYLLEQAILTPWEEEKEFTNHRDISLEVVREKVFELLHEELPHTTKQKLVSWKVLKDGSVRIEQNLIVTKKEHQKILVGKHGAVIGEIGIKARKELSTILGVNVHLILDVKLMTGVD